MARMKKVWSVRHRDGWCATANGECPPEEAASVPTACGQFVILPGGSDKLIPDFPDCLAALHAKLAAAA